MHVESEDESGHIHVRPLHIYKLLFLHNCKSLLPKLFLVLSADFLPLVQSSCALLIKLIVDHLCHNSLQ